MTKTKKFFLPVAALILAYVLWGINAPIIKYGIQTIPIPIYHSVVILGAALIILPQARKHWKKLTTKEFLALAVGAILAISVGNIALLIGLQYVPSVNAPLIGLLQPIFMYMLSIQFLRERSSAKTPIGIGVALVGAIVIIGPSQASLSLSHTLIIGNALLIVSTLLSSIGNIVCKSTLNHTISPSQVTFLFLLIGIIPTMLYALFFTLPETDFHNFSVGGVVAMIAGIVIVGAANLLYTYGLKQKQAQEVGVFTYMSPLAAIVVAWLLLAETPSSTTLIGAALIITGIYVSEFGTYQQKRKRRRKTSK